MLASSARSAVRRLPLREGQRAAVVQAAAERRPCTAVRGVATNKATGEFNRGRRIANRVVEGPQWHLIDAKDQVLGRLSTEVATKLMGKHKPSYLPNIDSGDYVVIINAKDVAMTGRKKEKKLYQWHTGWPGGLKEESAESLLSRKPEEVIRRSVLRMLPNNRMRKVRARKLRIFADANHTHHEELGQVGKA